jgi:hypothetical protein
LSWVDDLFEGKQVAVGPLISHKIDSAKSPSAEQVLDDIAALDNAAFWEDCPSGHILHPFTSEYSVLYTRIITDEERQ